MDAGFITGLTNPLQFLIIFNTSTSCKSRDNMNFDGLVKSRHPGENRGPDIFNYLIILDSCFRRNDENGLSATIYESIKIIDIGAPSSYKEAETFFM